MATVLQDLVDQSLRFVECFRKDNAAFDDRGQHVGQLKDVGFQFHRMYVINTGEFFNEQLSPANQAVADDLPDIVIELLVLISE